MIVINENLSKQLLTVLLLIIFSGCSDNSEKRAPSKIQNDHIWKEQTKTIERAREVESVIMDTAKRRGKQIEQQER